MTYACTADIQPIQVLQDQLRLLLRSDSSPYKMSVMVVDVPPGGFVPPHSHGHEEEGYFVLEGKLDLSIGEETRVLLPGDFGHVPPETIHGYENRGKQSVRFLAWTIGGPIDQFFEAMSQRVRTMPDDAAAMAELTQRFNVRMAGAKPPSVK